MENKTATSGFQRREEPLDGWAASIREKHGLPRDASLEQVETKAIELLNNPRTFISGAELVLGRRVDAQDEEVAPIVGNPMIKGEDKFGLLLLQKDVERMRAEQK